MSDHDAIDYDALAQAAWESTVEVNPLRGGPDGLIRGYTAIARAVVAALREQGLVVVPREDVRQVSLYVRNGLIPSSIRQSAERLSALAAPGDGEETR